MSAECNTVKWVNRYAPFYSDPKKKKKICDIPARTLVKACGVSTMEGFYERCIHVVGTTTVTGWIHTDDLEDYVRNYATNIVVLEDQTPNPNDFEQYVYFKSRVVQTNMCGEICLANVLRISLSTLLETWQQKKPGFFELIFKGGKAIGTGDSDLIAILEAHGREGFPLSTVLYQPHIQRARYTIKALNNLLQRGYIIMSVHINPNTGLLAPTGVLHWVTLKTLLPERNGQGFVTIFNPAMNCIESYSWSELMLSAGNPYGVYIPYGHEDEIYKTEGGMVWMENRN